MSIKLNIGAAKKEIAKENFYAKTGPGVNRPWTSSTAEEVGKNILQNRGVQAFVNNNPMHDWYLKDVDKSPKYFYRQTTSNAPPAPETPPSSTTTDDSTSSTGAFVIVGMIGLMLILIYTAR